MTGKFPTGNQLIAPPGVSVMLPRKRQQLQTLNTLLILPKRRQ